ncbi:hypothetical protein CQW23_19906 [Capsicum baccatum]|uniref:Uncharacterized protein n=2 Tax=Capsicum TaxID=4071 RepID=A0A2G3AJR6_CAPAN|nr:hypothetical protein CQW23_19906 [Capsicum baccatum]PHT94486.1 hypothetical protein T459_02368 [Capsicum annuum]
MKQPVRQTSYFLILGLEDPLSISIPVPAVRLALSPQSIAVTGCKRADCLLSMSCLGSWQSQSTLFRAFSSTLSAYWIGRYSLSSRLLIELVGNGREGNRQITGQLKEGNARGVSGLFCLACYWEERAAVILRFVRESTAHE